MKLSELFSQCINIKYNQSGDSANYAVKRENEILYIFFEGSNGESDWEVNLDFPAKPYKRMGQTAWYAHRGFLDIWKKTESLLSAYINDKTVERIIITGYSHGGAVALLCHEYAWFHRADIRNNIEGYGFGCPRVIWGIKDSGSKQRWKSFTVIRNLDDIVTHLPPSFMGYEHVGSLLEIGTNGKYSDIEAHFKNNILEELKIYEESQEKQ